jgi:uncharacterized membrane-anchored protein YhcB (DUF1043 family)
MDNSTVISLAGFVVTSLLSIIVWFLRNEYQTQKEAIKELQQDSKTFRSEFLHKNDFKEFKYELKSMFDELKQDIKDLKGHA